MNKRKYNFIDLFAGCGGLSEGFYRSDYLSLAHVEIDKWCCETLRNRMLHYGYSESDANKSVLELDITKEGVNLKIESASNKQEVDLVIGGPPCQAYSSAGRARDEKGMKEDPRNFLFENYVSVLNHFRPKFFVFENVIGILTAKVKDKKIINTILKELSKEYNICTDPNLLVFNTANYGVPQVRKRIIIIGVRKDLQINIEDLYKSLAKTHYDPDMQIDARKGLKKYVTVKDAIGDLPKLTLANKIIPFSSDKKNVFLKQIRSSSDVLLYDHVSRKHNDLDIQRYTEMSKNKWTFEQLLENRPDLGHPKKRVFNNSYAVQFWDKPARTIIAHLHKDGNQFIHPDYTQGRTLSVREAARLQSFPDNFQFSGAKTQQYKQIGNAVPPIFAYAIAECIKKYLNKIEK